MSARVPQQPPRAGPDGPVLHDYCLLPYDVTLPVNAWGIEQRPVTAADLPELADSTTLLRAAWAQMDRAAQGQAIEARLIEALGPHRTVWGVAWQPSSGAITVELYFYRRPWQRQDLSPALVTDALQGLVQVEQSTAPLRNWHMFSVQLDARAMAGERAVAWRTYSDVTGMSYAATADGLLLENRYDFHDPRRDIDAILQQLRASVHAPDTPESLAARLPPELMDCYHVCVAQKRRADAIYFSRARASAALWLMQRHAWPAPLRSVVADHGAQMQHIRWDLGMSYTWPSDPAAAGPGGLAWPKTGIYASF